MVKEYDVVIIGGGATGTATLYALSNYTNVKKIALIEKYDEIAQVNSQKDNNSQTLHFGDIETNYSVKKAKRVKEGAEMIRKYVENKKKEKLHSKSHKMVLGVGKDEAKFLKKRYKEFKKLFPELKMIDRKKIGELEPKVIKGRDPEQELVALYSPNGYIIDYGKMSKSFVKHSKKKGVDILLGDKVRSIEKEKGKYVIKTRIREVRAKAVVVAAGSHSLSFAYQMGYGKEWILLPVAGTFYYSKKKVNGKIYRMQSGIPFSAPHADPDVHNHNETRYGPLAKVLPMLERHKYKTVWEFLQLFELRLDAILAGLKIAFQPLYFKYLLKQVWYDIPVLGKKSFLKEVKKIIPTLKYSELKTDKDIGGIRPQILDVKKKELIMGDAKIVKDNIIFDITPSPGASVSLENGEKNAKKVVEFLDKKFYQKKFDKKYR